MSDLLIDVSPSLPRYAREDADEIIAGRRPGLGEALGANVREGWWGTTLGTLNARASVAQAEAEDSNPTPIGREGWQDSPWARPGMVWDERMTVARAQAMARVYDENNYRRSVMQARDAGALESVLGFGAQMLGSIPDPANFIPFAGPVTRGLRAVEAAGSVGARVAGGAARFLEGPGLAAGAGRGAIEGVLGNAAVAPIVYPIQGQFGDDVTAGRILTDLSFGALIGAGFGTAGAALARRFGVQPNPVVAARTLDSAARDLAAGRQIEMPSRIVAQNIEDTLFRMAPESAAPMIRETMDGGVVSRTMDLPTRPDGAGLSRAEFEAEFARRQGTTVEAQRAAAEDATRTARQEDQRQTLLQWVVANGGIRDDRGDVLASLGGTTRTRPGLISASGMAPDQAALRAREAGFFNDMEIRRNDAGEAIDADQLLPNDLFNAIDEELRGLGARRVGGFGAEDRAATSGDRMAADWERSVDEAFDWYQAALLTQDRIKRMAAPGDVLERAAIMEVDGGVRRSDAVAAAARESADPELQAALRQIDALRAEGRLSALDEAALKAGNEAGDEFDALARAITEAGACALRRTT